MVTRSFGFSVRLAQETDFPALYNLESESFPEDEAASEDTMKMRCAKANPYFMIVMDDTEGKIVGFVNGTCSPHKEIHHESMSTHDPAGQYLVIHSVTVSPSYRRKALGLTMLKDYVNYLVTQRHELLGVNLLSKAYLLGFYQRAGFNIDGLSSVQHGQDQWFDLSLDLAKKRNEVYLVDAFTSVAFKGNPAGVIFNVFPPQRMQEIAIELNQPVTSFVVPRHESGEAIVISPTSYAFDIRWFTATVELSLCGHGTIAAAFALYETGRVPRDAPIEFYSHFSAGADAGPAIVVRQDAQYGVQLSLRTLRITAVALSEAETAALLTCSCASSSSSASIVATVDEAAARTLLVELTPVVFHAIPVHHHFGALRPLYPRYRKIIFTCTTSKHNASAPPQNELIRFREYGGTTGVVGEGTDAMDFCSRVALLNPYPGSGESIEIVEDPVCGSAHTALGPYWATNHGLVGSAGGGAAGEPVTMLGYQCSPRGGKLVVTVVAADPSQDNGSPVGPIMFLSGTCTMVSTGVLLI